MEELIGVGELFGFSAGATRVALVRLVKNKVAARDARGLYRQHPKHFLVDEWVATWRQGRKKTTRWDGSWLSVSLALKLSFRQRQDSHKALERLGFCEGLPRLWVRPNNLRQRLEELKKSLVDLGLSTESELFISQGFSSKLIQNWLKNLWSQKQLNKRYTELLSELKKSQRKCQRSSLAKSLVESFQLGGEVIWALARDPLLPEELASPKKFEALTQAMLHYDHLGRQLWQRRLPQLSLQVAPKLTLLKSA